MRLPLHAVQLSNPIRAWTNPDPSSSVSPMEVIRHAVDTPLFSRTVVLDAIDLPYAYDFVVNDGFYLLIMAYALFRYLAGRNADL